MAVENFENLNFDLLETNHKLTLSDSFDPDVNFFRDIKLETNYLTPQETENIVSNSVYKFSLFHINIRSIKKNFTDLKTLLHNLSFKFKVICLTETWIHDDYLNSNFQLPGYSVIHQKRAHNKQGGGVCVFVHNSITYNERKDLSTNNTDSILSLITNVKI